MKSIRTVNLLWETKTRASYPVSRYALNDEGVVALAMPRPLEARSFDLTFIDKKESKTTGSGFSVETLVKLEISPESQTALGMTSDDLYLIEKGVKGRFLGEKSLLYIDSCLSGDGEHVAAGFTDLSGTSFCIAFGSVSGGAKWLHEVDEAISCITLSPDGTRVLTASELGRISMMDASRRDLWGFEGRECVRRLALTKGGKFSAYGTVGGVVGLIDHEGTRKWETNLPGSVASLALSEDGEVCAALCESEEGNALVYCLTGTGQIGWEYDPERKFATLALSPNGSYLALSGRDGTHVLHEIVFGEGDSGGLGPAVRGVPFETNLSGGFDQNRENSDNSESQGGIAGELAALRSRLSASLIDVSACENYLETSQSFTDAQLEEAKAYEANRDFNRAISTLQSLLRTLPESIEGANALHLLRRRLGELLLEEGRSHLASGDLRGAESSFAQGVYCNPYSLDLRREIAGLNHSRAEEGDREADALIAENKIEEAVATLERTQAMEPSEPRASKIRWAQNVLEFKLAMSAYNDKRYREAVFQFKKVLARDPNHSEAKRYLAFAQRFDNDANNALNDRFSRLEGVD